MILLEEYCQVLNEASMKEHGVFNIGDKVINYKSSQDEHPKAGHSGKVSGNLISDSKGNRGHMVEHRDGTQHFHKVSHLTHL